MQLLDSAEDPVPGVSTGCCCIIPAPENVFKVETGTSESTQNTPDPNSQHKGDLFTLKGTRGWGMPPLDQTKTAAGVAQE